MFKILQMLHLLLHLLHILQISRRIVGREQGSYPLNRHFVSAGSTVHTAEMTQLQRFHGSNPPPCNLHIPLL
jgi:hypothetical protein